MPPPPFGRLLTAMVTPFQPDGALDLEAAAALQDLGALSTPELWRELRERLVRRVKTFVTSR